MATSVHDLIRESEALASTRKKIFNPDLEDFTVNFHGEPYTIHAQEIEEFDHPVAEHIKKHLAKYLMGKSGSNSLPTEADWDKINKKIEVDYYGE